MGSGTVILPHLLRRRRRVVSLRFAAWSIDIAMSFRLSLSFISRMVSRSLRTPNASFMRNHVLKLHSMQYIEIMDFLFVQSVVWFDILRYGLESSANSRTAVCFRRYFLRKRLLKLLLAIFASYLKEIRGTVSELGESVAPECLATSRPENFSFAWNISRLLLWGFNVQTLAP